jgi:hypothetical protein
MTEPQITRMYPNGPLRLFGEQPFLGGRPYKDAEREGFIGEGYVCELCQQRVPEVVVGRGSWCCRGCQTSGQRIRDERGSTMKATRTTR